ncbi:hypothetical protein LMG26689_00994 [Achromobacter animicus]|nr:hypothetical protein LMG26689_00994 [Achromobacter animicus]
MVGGGRPVRRAAGLISFRNRRVGPMKRPNRYCNNRPRWPQNPSRPPLPDRSSRGAPDIAPTKKRPLARVAFAFCRRAYSVTVAPMSVAVAAVMAVAGPRASPFAAVVITAATVIHRPRINDGRRDINRCRTVIHRWGRCDVHRRRGHVDGCGVDDAWNTDGDTNVHAGQSDAGNQQTCGTDTCNKPFFHLAPACCETQQS